MKVLEVKNGFIKFLADSTLKLSSFVKIIGIKKRYVAQIFQLKQNLGEQIAYAKILFNINEGNLSEYDKSSPEINSKIILYTQEILNNSLIAQNPIIVGKTLDKNINIVIDSIAFDKKMFVSVDDAKISNLLISNFVKQFKNLNKNSIIIDTLGNLNTKAYIAGVDFKLPLNRDALEFLYKECLADATAESKSLIMDIFKDLYEYTKTVEFLPFEMLKSIVDNMVDKEHVFKLIVLKNKLAKYDRLGYFANNYEEVNKIRNILTLDCAVINLSKLDNLFLNRYLIHIFNKLEEETNTQVFLTLSNLVDKRSIGKVINNSKVSSTIFTHSKFKYIVDILNIFDNFIVIPSITNNRIFSAYSNFLENMSKDSYLIVGEATNYIPLASKLLNITDVIQYNIVEEINENIENLNNNIEEIEQTETIEEINDVSESDDISTQIEDNQEEILDEKIDMVEENVDGIIDNTQVDSIEEELQQSESIQENIEKPTISQEELIANIDNHSEEIIAEIAENNDNVIPDNLFIDEPNDDIEEEILTIVQNENLEDELDNNNDNIQYDEVSLQEDLNYSDEVNNDVPQTLDLETQNEANEELQILSNNLEQNQQEIINNDLLEGIELDLNKDVIITNDIQEIELDNNEEKVLETDIEIEDLEDENAQSRLLENENEAEIIEVSGDIHEELEQINLLEEVDLENNDIKLKELTKDNSNIIDETSEQYKENPENIIPIKNLDEDFGNLEEFVELDPNDLSEDDIIIDMVEDESLPDNVDEQVVQDVDKVFTTIKDDGITDSDLDFIEELDNKENELEFVEDEELQEISNNSDIDILEFDENTHYENNEIEEYVQNSNEDKEISNDEILPTKSSSTPLVPVYSAEIPKEDMVVSDPITQGDYVYHAKCGNGIVEKMIKYGNKTLFSINFDNIGRRLMDPNLTELKKVR